MNNIDILGHDNFALAIQFDMLKNIYESLPNIRIITNINTSDNINRNFAFAMEGDAFQVIMSEEWQPDVERNIILGAMSGKTMKTIFDHFNNIVDLGVFQFLNLIHPDAYIALSAKLGKGIIMEPNSTISSHSILHDHIWIKRNSSIGHHTEIHSFTNINPGVTIASCCEIGSNCLIGVGATISDKIKIGENSIIGAGSVVTKNIPENVVAYGVPAKIIRHI